jgi:hypothetical protein
MSLTHITLPSVYYPAVKFRQLEATQVIVTGEEVLPQGSKVAPSLTFLGDTNTGLYSSGSDTVSVAAGGDQIADFSNTGNTIIGQTSLNDISGFPNTRTAAYNNGGNASILKVDGAAGSMISITHPINNPTPKLQLIAQPIAYPYDLQMRLDSDINVSDQTVSSVGLIIEKPIAGQPKGIKLVNDSIIGYSPSSLNCYEEKNLSQVINDFAFPETVQVQITRIGRQVSLSVTGLQAAYGAASSTVLILGIIPSHLRPQIDSRCVVPVYDAVVEPANVHGLSGLCVVYNNGNLLIARGVNLENFSAGALCGWSNFTMSYNII